MCFGIRLRAPKIKTLSPSFWFMLKRGAKDKLSPSNSINRETIITLIYKKICKNRAARVLLAVRTLLLLFLFIPMHLQAQVGTTLYMLDATNNRLLKSNADGSSLTVLINGAPLNGPHGIAVDASNAHVYLVNTNSDEVYRTDLDGSNLVVLVNSGLNEPIGLELDVQGGYFYVSDRGANKIIRYDLGGGNATDALTINLNWPHNFALDLIANKFFVASRTGGEILSADLMGNTGIAVLANGLGQPYGVALDRASNYMYFTQFASGNITRTALDGTGQTVIVAGLNQPTGLRLDATNGYLYFTEWAGQKVRRVDVDGTNLMDILVAGDGLGQMINLDMYTPDSSGSSETTTRYIPFRSEILLLLLLALTGLWLVKSPRW